MSSTPEPKLVIISGPSGAGKSSVLRQLLETCSLPLALSVSATTRPARPDEQDGVDYFFISKQEFARRRDAGEFLECVEVFDHGHWYGTLRSQVTAGLSAGKWVVLEIDVEGARNVLQQEPCAITVFLHPGSMEELERRLRERGTESEDSIARRLKVAAEELAASDQYAYRVVNHNIDQAAKEICRILTAHGEDKHA